MSRVYASLIPLLVACGPQVDLSSDPQEEVFHHPLPLPSAEPESVLQGVLVAPLPEGSTARVDVMGLPDEGGGVLGYAELPREGGAFQVALTNLRPRVNLWLGLDIDADGVTDLHYSHPDNPFSLAVDAPIHDVRVDIPGEAWAQRFPPGEDTPRYYPGGLPVEGVLSIPGFTGGTIQLDIWADPATRHELVFVMRYRAPGAFRGFVPAGTSQILLLFFLDEDGDGMADRRYEYTGNPLTLTASGVSGLDIHIEPGDWQDPSNQGPVGVPPLGVAPEPEPATGRPVLVGGTPGVGEPGQGE